MGERPETLGGTPDVSLLVSHIPEGSCSVMCLESQNHGRTELKGHRDHEWMCLKMGPKI